jgi:hypothetical protein
LDLLNNAYVNTQTNNYSDFNTMQNLFSTQNQTPTYQTPTYQVPTYQTPPTYQAPPSQPPTYNNFNTITGMNATNQTKNNTNFNPLPNMFSTVSYTSPTLNNQTFTNDNQLNIFTSMQNMPQMINPPFQPISQIPTNINLIQNPAYQSGSDFNTKQNLFATQNQVQPSNQTPINTPTLTTNFNQQGQLQGQVQGVQGFKN